MATNDSTTARPGTTDAIDRLTMKLSHLRAMLVLPQDNDALERLSDGLRSTYLHGAAALVGECEQLAQHLWTSKANDEERLITVQREAGHREAERIDAAVLALVEISEVCDAISGPADRLRKVAADTAPDVAVIIALSTRARQLAGTACALLSDEPTESTVTDALSVISHGARARSNGVPFEQVQS